MSRGGGWRRGGGLWILLAALPALALLAMSLGRYPAAGFVPWRDVTDDQESGTVYTWFNIGADRARQTHRWDEAISVPLAETTEE